MAEYGVGNRKRNGTKGAICLSRRQQFHAGKAQVRSLHVFHPLSEIVEVINWEDALSIPISDHVLDASSYS